MMHHLNNYIAKKIFTDKKNLSYSFLPQLKVDSFDDEEGRREKGML
jgi:hypothetical protein